MPIARFPHRYAVAIADGVLTAEPRPPVQVGVPPQFGGSDQVWSPEELLVAAALLCLQTTFAAYAQQQGLTFHGWRGSAVGQLDRTAAGPAFTAIEMAINLSVEPGDEERAKGLMATAERHCIISRALTVPISTALTINAVPELAA